MTAAASGFDTRQVRQQIADAQDALGLGLSGLQIDSLLTYVNLIDKWNQTYNLTAVREPKSMAVQHIADCLAIVGSVRREIAGQTKSRVLDVGSGAGLPGVVLAIAEPRLMVVCIDSVGKKAAFISHTATTVNLRNLTAVHGRVQDEAASTFEIICSRAFSSLQEFTQLTGPLLAPAGVWMAMKGRVPDDEIADLPPAVKVFHVEHLTVPSLKAERCLVWMRPTLLASKHPLSEQQSQQQGSP